MSSRMRITRGKTGSRRSHHRLTGPRLSHDKETDSTHKRHHVDLATGMYRGKKIFEPKVVEVSQEEEVAEEKTEEEVVEEVKEKGEKVQEKIEEAVEKVTEEKKEN